MTALYEEIHILKIQVRTTIFLLEAISCKKIYFS